MACATGMRRALGPGRGRTWGPRLVGALGAGLVVAGVCSSPTPAPASPRAVMYGFVGALTAHLLRGLPDHAG